MAENMVRLTAMTPEMYHRYFREYENDSDLYLDKDKYTAYTYSKEKVDQYIQRQVDLKRPGYEAGLQYIDEQNGDDPAVFLFKKLELDKREADCSHEHHCDQLVE